MKQTIWLLAVLWPGWAIAQQLNGKLYGNGPNGREVLPGGTVRWLGTTIATFSNENGVFTIPPAGVKDLRLIATATGYRPDTIDATGKTYVSISLQPEARELQGVTIADRRGAHISSLSVGQTEVINQRELSKAACCDLAGCFGTQASVQAQTTNVVTNAQELRILGLSGVYNQVLLDGVPAIGGLSYTYGISSYPGSVVGSIMVARGATSVLQGHDGISGQINIETRQPHNTDKLFVNAYMNSFGEKHLNANVAGAIGKNKKWHTMLALHTVQPARVTDGNNDGFMDLPRLTRYMAYNKWRYGNEADKGFSMQAGLRATTEQRVGGQTGAGHNEGSTTVYEQCIHYVQPEGYVKARWRFSPAHVVAVSVMGQQQRPQAWFGTTSYTARQQYAWVNAQHEWQWHTQHQLKYGIGYRYQQLTEDVAFTGPTLGRTYAGHYTTRLSVPGAFAENTFRWLGDKLNLITGLRADQHQQWGTYVTPRSMLKYVASTHHTFRASGGSGWRQVFLFPEQVNLLASSRNVVFEEPLKPEKAVNWGVSHVYRLNGRVLSGTIATDFYSTRFSNQFFPDYDTDPTKAIIRNFTGPSRSNALQVDANMVLLRMVEVRMAYNYLSVFREVGGVKTQLPFNPGHRAMGAVSYTTANRRWQADANLHWYDRMRLPDTRSNPEPYRRPLWSVPYTTLAVQLTWRWRTLDVYAGCENLTNYRQPNPIISATNPFGPYFDLSSVWGPVRGRELYMGIRYAIR